MNIKRIGSPSFLIILITVFFITGCDFFGSSSSDVATTQIKPHPRTAVSPDSIANHRQNAITRAVEHVSSSIVSVSVTEVVRGNRGRDPFYGFFFPDRVREYNSVGTGFVVSPDGHIVTNQHVIGENPTKIIVTMGDGQDYKARLLGTDTYGDIALLKIDEKDLPYAKFGNSDEIIIGEWAIALGNPFGLFDDGQASVTVGVISATKRDFKPNPQEPRVYLDMIQTDAAINQGNSGGPLVNSLGEVIGINTFIYTGGTSSGFVGLGFAIPSNTVVKIIRQLKESGEVSLEYDLGMDVQPITIRTVRQYNLPAIQGVFVHSVNRDGPSYQAGVLPGDVLIEFDGERIFSHTHFQALLREQKAGEEVTLVLLRKGKLYETTIELMKKG
jgi:serine protease Do